MQPTTSWTSSQKVSQLSIVHTRTHNRPHTPSNGTMNKHGHDLVISLPHVNFPINDVCGTTFCGWSWISVGRSWIIQKHFICSLYPGLYNFNAKLLFYSSHKNKKCLQHNFVGFCLTIYVVLSTAACENFTKFCNILPHTKTCI